MRELKVGDLVRTSKEGVYASPDWKGALALVITRPAQFEGYSEKAFIWVRRLSDGAENGVGCRVALCRTARRGARRCAT